MDQTTVLIVDRRSVLCDGLSTQLASLPDISVVGWGTSIGSLESMVERTHPSVVVLDADMVRGGGSKALARLVALRDGPAVVLIAGSYNADEAMDALRAGATAFVLRVGRLEDLVTAIRCAKSEQAWISPALLVALPGNLQRQSDVGGERPRLDERRDDEFELHRFLFTNSRIQKLRKLLDGGLDTFRSQGRNLRLKLNVDRDIRPLSPPFKGEVSA